MNKSPAFQLYPKDFLVDTAMMTAEEVGAYMRLLCYAWVGLPGFEQGYIPGDERVFNLVGLSFEEWEKVRSKVMGYFCEKSEGVYYHKRLMSELEKQKSFRKQRVIAGKASGIARNKRSTSVEREPNFSFASSSSTPLNPPRGEGGGRGFLFWFSKFQNELQRVGLGKNTTFDNNLLKSGVEDMVFMAAVLEVANMGKNEAKNPPGLISFKCQNGINPEWTRKVENKINPQPRAVPNENAQPDPDPIPPKERASMDKKLKDYLSKNSTYVDPLSQQEE